MASLTPAGRLDAPASSDAASGQTVRVLIVAPSLDILGGQAVQAARLLDNFRREPSLEVDFLPINPRLPGVAGKLQTIRYIRTALTTAAYTASLLRQIRRYDVVHIFSASYFSFVLAPTPALLVAKLYGKSAILNYRSGEADDHLRRWRRTAIPTIRTADEIVVPSGYLVRVFADFGLHARSIHNFVDTNQFGFRVRRPLQPILLSNRSLEPLYNIACTLRAFAAIQRTRPDARLIVAGDGSLRAELEALASALHLRNTEFLGRVPQDRMPALYAEADVFLNSPNIDNMPGSIIEAFAAGLPVVTTDAGGIPYIVTDGETGLIVPRGDHEAMASCAIRLLEDGDLATRIARQAHEECQKYSWEAVRSDWLDLYHGLARKKGNYPREQPAGSGHG